MRTKLSTMLAALLVLAGCGDGVTTGEITLAFAANSAASATAAPSAWASPAAVTAGGNTIEFTSVKIVLREIELEPVSAADCDVTPEPAGCEDWETGPMLIDLVLTGLTTATDVSIMNIAEGTYDEVEFDIHKVSASDGTFVDDHPEMEGKSILVVGTWDDGTGTGPVVFTFETDLNEEQEFTLVDPIVVTSVEATQTTNVTINLDVNTWFTDGTDLIDPRTAAKGEPNENLVKDNIKNSIDVFEDSDHDGHH